MARTFPAVHIVKSLRSSTIAAVPSDILTAMLPTSIRELHGGAEVQNCKLLVSKLVKAQACLLSMGSLHDGLTCGIGIAALNILEGSAAVDDEVFGPSAEVDKVQGAEEQRLYDKVPVTDSVHGVGAHPTKEAQLLCNELPVNSKGVACQCTCQQTKVTTPSSAANIDLAQRDSLYL